MELLFFSVSSFVYLLLKKKKKKEKHVHAFLDSNKKVKNRQDDYRGIKMT